MNRYIVDPDQAVEAAKQALRELTLTDTQLTWLSVHGALQLALRHPQLKLDHPDTAYRLEVFVSRLGFMLMETGFLTPEILAEAVKRETELHEAQRRLIGDKK